MEALIVLSLSLAYVFLYSLSSFLFNYKAYLISNDKYNLAAFISGLALFIGFSLYAFVPYFAIILVDWWVVIFLIFSLAIGSFGSTVIMNKVDLFHEKQDNKKEDLKDKEKNKENKE